MLIGREITLETLGGAMGESDYKNTGNPTNIQTGSPLANVLARLQKNDRVTFGVPPR